jgi:head-tail adaptor
MAENLGPLDRRIIIERKVAALDSFGEPTDTWEAMGGVRWASRYPIRRNNPRFGNVNIVGIEKVMFIMRWSSDLAGACPMDRLSYASHGTTGSPNAPDEQYQITEVREMGRREGLKVIAIRQMEP